MGAPHRQMACLCCGQGGLVCVLWASWDYTPAQCSTGPGSGVYRLAPGDDWGDLHSPLARGEHTEGRVALALGSGEQPLMGYIQELGCDDDAHRGECLAGYVGILQLEVDNYYNLQL